MSSQEKHPAVSSPHDAVFRRILGKPGNAASQLRSTLPMPLLGPEAKEAYVTTADMLRAEGEAKGEAKGRAEALVQIMTIKFGILEQSVLDRVYAGSVQQIELWTDRVLTAETVEDVLR